MFSIRAGIGALLAGLVLATGCVAPETYAIDGSVEAQARADRASDLGAAKADGESDDYDGAGWPVGSDLMVAVELGNLRAGTGTDTAIVAELPKGTRVTVQGEPEARGGYTWYPVDAGEYGQGYVATVIVVEIFVKTDQGWEPGTELVISVPLANLRQGAGTDTPFRAELPKLTELTVLDGPIENGGYTWYQVDAGTYGLGYVATLVVIEASDAGSLDGGIGQQMVDFASQFLGYRYTTPANVPYTFDCSGLTNYTAMNILGYAITWGVPEQLAYGRPVRRDELEAGDLVFFLENLNHVGMYVGNNKFIHAENWSTGVKISDLGHGWGDYYFDHYTTARRLAE